MTILLLNLGYTVRGALRTDWFNNALIANPVHCCIQISIVILKATGDYSVSIETECKQTVIRKSIG